MIRLFMFHFTMWWEVFCPQTCTKENVNCELEHPIYCIGICCRLFPLVCFALLLLFFFSFFFFFIVTQTKKGVKGNNEPVVFIVTKWIIEKVHFFLITRRKAGHRFYQVLKSEHISLLLKPSFSTIATCNYNHLPCLLSWSYSFFFFCNISFSYKEELNQLYF